jgi:peptide/nickel transport system permease protein
VLRRVVLLVPFLIGLTLFTFILSHVVPADPAALAAGKHATEEMREKVRREYGLDEPLHVQYFMFLRRIIRADFGRSLETRRPVVYDLSRFYPATLELTLAALFLAVLLGIPLGVISARFRDRWPDHIARLFALGGASLPRFWLAIIFQLVVTLFFPVWPIQGRFDDNLPLPPNVTGLLVVDSLLHLDFRSSAVALKHLFLPALTLALSCLADISRLTRSGMIEAMRKDFVLTARASGLPELTILFRHVLRYTVTPLLTISGLLFTWIAAGAVLVELIFTWPGLGRYAVRSNLFMDYNPLLAVVLTIGLTCAAVNLIVDILYGLVDPRVRYG